MAAGFVAALAAGFAAGLGVALAALALPAAPLPAGALLIPAMSMSIEAIPRIPAIMRCSTGSVITRSRITGSAIMRMWMAIRLVSVTPMSDMFMPDMFMTELDALAAPLNAPAPGTFMPE